MQLQIESKRLPTLQELCETTTDEFYRSAKGDNYAQARYLCYYLQEKELLNKYYHSFRENIRKDPSGYQTLKQILEATDTDMSEFNQKWQKYCLGLKYPE